MEKKVEFNWHATTFVGDSFFFFLASSDSHTGVIFINGFVATLKCGTHLQTFHCDDSEPIISEQMDTKTFLYILLIF